MDEVLMFELMMVMVLGVVALPVERFVLLFFVVQVVLSVHFSLDVVLILVNALFIVHVLFEVALFFPADFVGKLLFFLILLGASQI